MSDESLVKHLDTPAKTLKLSEAIRIGSRIRPQITCGYYSDGIGSCAIGAAWEAMTGKLARKTVPEKWYSTVISPANSIYCIQYDMTIITDNDSGMSRERIADRLEAIGF